MDNITIRTPFIKLEQALKLSGSFPTGGKCKEAIQEGRIQVNGAVCLMRGKKLRDGDTFSCGEKSWKVEAV